MDHGEWDCSWLRIVGSVLVPGALALLGVSSHPVVYLEVGSLFSVMGFISLVRFAYLTCWAALWA